MQRQECLSNRGDSMTRYAISVRCIVSTLLVTSTVVAQRPVGAPVPSQVLTARTVFIGNGGSESYGADSYYRLTRYDGGPNRAYESFYNAIREWGHYEIVDSTRDADVVLVIRFANPIVDQTDATGRNDPTQYPIYDPQLHLSINDPRSGLALWSITEHIEPGDNRSEDNRHFNEAVTRLVDDLERIILRPESAVADGNVIPPGAVRVEIRRRRATHAFIGGLLGGVVGGIATSRIAGPACNDNVVMFPPLPGYFPPNPSSADFGAIPDLSCEAHRERTKMRNEFIGGIGGTVIGSILGWVFPVSF